MVHAARAALLAVEGSASTNHRRVVETFERMAKRRRGKALREHAATLKTACKLRIEADYGSKDLTEVGRQLRERVAPFSIVVAGSSINRLAKAEFSPASDP